MFKALSAVGSGLMFLVFSVSPVLATLKPMELNARSAILIDMQTGDILHEQDADLPIAPASLTKILTLYVVSEAIKNGEVHLWDEVHVSRKAAMTGGSRMGLRAGTLVPMEELIKGMAVVSG
ncbi:MAG: D-alanyl-D-alanine carboxypeptidase, partial [Syntrophobacteraceae bacterium]|nr:D-alanyl-D-alanine carboxypeptidase [Syntrophobacteraceae bacterium]